MEERIYPPPLHLPFDGLLSPEEVRLIVEGELENYPQPLWETCEQVPA